MARPLDYERARRELLSRLGVVGVGTARELARHLGISQPAFSRVVGSCRDELIVMGKGRATRYAARRSVTDVGQQVPLYEVDTSGGTRRLGTLHPIRGEGFWVESADDDLRGGLFADLPYFLFELRPQGFLGRRIPERHPELSSPPDIQLWSADHCLQYLVRYGWDTVGAWLVGDGALNAYLEHIDAPPNPVELTERSSRYRDLCEDALRDAPGSSAGGEQPKFLATKLVSRAGREALDGEPPPTATPVLVKFSPPIGERIGRRAADLLIAEHLAQQVLNERGIDAARSELLLGDDRLFLEVERFDRTPEGGRRGVLSLMALDAEFVGSARSWTDTAERLFTLGHLDAESVWRIRWADCFGRLIANTDRHLGNLSLLTRGTRVLSVAPLYDMLPMSYAPSAGHIGERQFQLQPVQPAEADVWDAASEAAISYWRTLSADPRVSQEFRAICRTNVAIVEKWRMVAQRSPWGRGQ